MELVEWDPTPPLGGFTLVSNLGPLLLDSEALPTELLDARVTIAEQQVVVNGSMLNMFVTVLPRPIPLDLKKTKLVPH